MNPNPNNERPVIDTRKQTGTTPQQPGTAKTCGLCVLPVKEVLQHILKDAKQAHSILKSTNSQNDIHIVLDRIHGYQVDSRVSQRIKNVIADIRGSVCAMRLHDITRTQMCEMLQQLLTFLQEEIAQEEHNERVHRVRALFTVLAEHADEVTCWFEQSGVCPF